MNTNPKSPNQPYTGQFYKAQPQTGGKTEIPTAAKGDSPAQADQPAQGTKNTLSPDKILSLPKGGGAIKGIGEKFQANPLTGTGSVSVPLPLSPGRGDFTPQLALSYDSGSGNSAFGLGFSVGLPSITRKTDKGLPQYHDNDESDVFVMSGAEDLVRLTDGSGVVVAPTQKTSQGTDYRVFGYRPRTEGLFARIERWEEVATGVSHWRATTRDNITTVYGLGTNARIVHPSDPVKVFQWMIERSADNRGNLIEYQYKPEDASNITPSVFEARRLESGEAFNQRYLKKVCYGNYTISTVVDAPYTGGWHFEMVFDYGEHTGTVPAYTGQTAWECRPDPFSTFRSGFEVRTYRLCSRMVMFHRFAETGGSPFAVKMLALTHDRRPELTLLQSITLTGFDSSQPQESFPPLRFSYTEPLPAAQCQQLASSELQNFPGGEAFRWTDLYGEGLSGVLMQGAEAWYYKPNLGDRRYYETTPGDAPELWLGAMTQAADRPNLPAGAAQLGDIDGNGRPDLRVMQPGMAGFAELDAEGRWETFLPFRHIPNIDLNDPNLRMIDLTGDGHADILITENSCFTAHYSEARDGFGQARRTTKPADDAKGPAVVFSDETQSVYLADMSGDGLTDIVRIRNGAVDYWPNLGYGRFGRKVSMQGAPRFDATDKFEQQRIRLADVDGTGTTDIIYLGTKTVRYWKNRAGNSWSTAEEISHFPTFGRLADVSVMDLMGNGTSCLTAMVPARNGLGAALYYLELTGGRKPFLLYEMDNNMGAVTTLTYAPSTKFYLKDKLSGHPWITKLSFPVHVVESSEVHDLPTDTRYTTRYAYHHGYFDGVEREFRGFGMVEQWDTDTLHPLALQGEADQPPVYTKTWFHTGALHESGAITLQYASEYFNDPKALHLPDTTLPEGLSAAEMREACRALRGSILRQEVYAADGSDVESIPYTVAEKTYAVRMLQPRGTNPHAVFHVTEYDALAFNYERNTGNPRVVRQMTLETDTWGNVTKAATISYLSRTHNMQVTEQNCNLFKYDENSFINQPANALYYRIGVPYQQISYELHNTGFSASFFTHEALLAWISAATTINHHDDPGTTAAKRLLSHKKSFFYNTACDQRLPLGEIAAHGQPYHTLTLAFDLTCRQKFVAFNTEQGTANTLLPSVSTMLTLLTQAGYEVDTATGQHWHRSERFRPIPSWFYQPFNWFDAKEQCAFIEWDDSRILPVLYTDPIGFETSVQNDYRVLHPWLMTDPNGALTFYQFNPLGLVTKMAVQGASGEGDTLDEPTLAYNYHLLNWMMYQLPVASSVQAREIHGGLNTRWLTSKTWSDGLGRELQTKVQAEDGEAFTIENGSVVTVNTTDRWVATGRTVYNNKGKVIRQYEPWFSANGQYEPEDELCRYGVTPLMTYDPLGRLIRTDFPDGTTSRVEFDAWQQKNYDRNDCVADSPWYAVMSAGTTAQQRAASLALQHNNTPQVIDLDTLGRPVRVTDDNGTAGSYVTYSRLDILGRVTQVTDAKGRLMTRYFYSIDGQLIHTHNIDSGHRWMISNSVQLPLHSWDNRSNRIQYSYNANQQLMGISVQENGTTTWHVIEQRTYGDVINATAYFRGRLTSVRLQERKTTIDEYDFKGNILSLTTIVCTGYNVDNNCTSSSSLTGTFTQQSTFDAMNRPVTQTAPNNQATAYTYGKGGLLDGVTVSGTAYLTDIAYNARGQRTDVWFGNGSKTRYEYDTDTFRLTRLLTTRNSGSDVLQDITYTYDPEGNIVQQTDAAQQTFYFSNSVVAPTGLYEYDALYRLTKAEGRELTSLGMATDTDFVNNLAVPNPATNAMQNYTQLFTYDELGNMQAMQSQGRWTRNYIYDTATNRLLRHEGTTDVYTYDSDGNITSMPHLTEMQWNGDGRLRRTTNGTVTTWYCYDASGNRVRKVTEKPGGVTEERIYLGNYEVYTKKIGSTIQTRRETLHITDDQHRFALIDTLTVDNGTTLSTPVVTTRYQYDNHLGSASLELDQNAAIISYEEYHPFGTTSYRSGRTETEVALKRYKYVGKERDEETGLYYYGARYYAAWLCRFVSVDPLQFKYPHYTPYQYAGNKPVSYIDLDGLEEYRLPTIPYHTKGSGGVADNSTVGKTVDNTFAALGNTAIGMVNFLSDLSATISTTVSYNAEYIYDKGVGTWAGDVINALGTDLKTAKDKTVSFLQKPAEEQWHDVDNYMSSPAGYELVVNLAAMRFMAEIPTSSLSFKPSLRLGSSERMVSMEATVARGAAVEEAGVAAKTSTSLVQANRTAGNLFRDELAAALRAEGRVVRTEVFKRTPFGPRYIDIDVRYNGVNLGGIEAKVGGSRYLPLQRLKDAWLGANGYPVQLVRKPPTL